MTTGEISESSTPLSNHSNRRHPAGLIGTAYALRPVSLDEGVDGTRTLLFELREKERLESSRHYRDTGAPATILRYYHRR